MSKRRVVLVLGWVGLMMSSGTMANWQGDCQMIESQGPSSGACKAIESRVSDLQSYAPLKTFIDPSEDGSELDKKFSWGTPQWGGGGGGAGGAGGGSGVLPGDQGSGGSSGSSGSTGSDSSGTFQ